MCFSSGPALTLLRWPERDKMVKASTRVWGLQNEGSWCREECQEFKKTRKGGRRGGVSQGLLHKQAEGALAATKGLRRRT